MIRFEWKTTVPVIVACFGLFGCQPDLEVSLVANGSYAEGEEIGSSLEINVANTGNASALGNQGASGSGYTVDVVLSSDASVPVQYATVPSPYAFEEDMLLKGGRLSITQTLAGGASQTYSAASPPFDVTGLIPPGAPSPCYLCAVVDPGDKITESDEANNTFCTELTITKPKPDLVVSLNAEESYAVGVDLAATLEIVVTNQGLAEADGTDTAPTNGYMVDLVLSLDTSVPLTFASVPSPYVFQEDMMLQGGRLSNTVALAAGASRTFSQALPPFDVTGLIPAGTPQGVNLCAVVDPGQKIDEIDETNNTYCKAIDVISP